MGRQQPLTTGLFAGYASDCIQIWMLSCLISKKKNTTGLTIRGTYKVRPWQRKWSKSNISSKLYHVINSSIKVTMTRSSIRRTRQAAFDMHGTASLSLCSVRGPGRATAKHQTCSHTATTCQTIHLQISYCYWVDIGNVSLCLTILTDIFIFCFITVTKTK